MHNLNGSVVLYLEFTEKRFLAMEHDSCPVCKTDKYLVPTMQLFATPCFHVMCETCALRLFPHGSAPCPTCKISIKKSEFFKPVFSDLVVEKEIRVRKRVQDVMNKRLDDFQREIKSADSALEAYNDYLEQIEDIVYDLVYGHNIAEREQQLKEEFNFNTSEIKKSRLLLEEEDQRIRDMIHQEEIEKQLQRQADLEHILQEEKLREKERKMFMKALESNKPLPRKTVLHDNNVTLSTPAIFLGGKEAKNVEINADLEWRDSFICKELKHIDVNLADHLIDLVNKEWDFSSGLSRKIVWGGAVHSLHDSLYVF
ncbi:Zinc finger, RING-type domain-containing protein [Rozella allomycis CSF55]|uniref:Zinc finger, RING-type domain-containing protein n=1 Tax=Rozella allomycis (strain CSF55) TaxID=988480 RepID=A0A075ANI9_ROZAC|nr:Zinc finger, RING-type domain-containing protein [Rozella allomycis CSF55]|eukprot:EPZ31445.1 Zinc finger, RING-type domain-containing protein [Rozella allomycis CSF55]